MSTRTVVVAAAVSLASGLLAVPLATAAAPTAVVAPSTRAPAAAAASFRVRPIDWGRCRDPFLRKAGGRCGMLVVPLDHADPAGPTIRLAVSRVKHRGPSYRGVMFTNPGGPGGAGTYLAGLGQYVPGRVGATYDWVGMDPRGVGASRPALTCDKRVNEIGTRPPYDPTTSAILDAWVARSEAYAADCGTAAAAALLPHMRTTDTVADLELLRRALGVRKVSFYGFSYGTYIAQVYVTLHPERIDKLVLDGVVDPRGIWYAANKAQNVGFEKAVTRFYRWAARGHADYRLGRTAARVEKTYYRLLRRLARKPVDGVGAAELADLTLGAGYASFLWPETAQMLSEIATDGTAKQARKAYTSSYPTVQGGDNDYATYLATTCTDAPWPTDLDLVLADNERHARRDPFVTWSNAWFNAPCRTWPAAPGTPVEVATTDRPALLVNETFDAATPIAGAYEVRRRFSGAVLIEGVGGMTHAGSLNGVDCVDSRIATYLATGRLPARRPGDRSDVRCGPVPPPPTGAPDSRMRTSAQPRPVLPVG